jgi:hypothetical protein
MITSSDSWFPPKLPCGRCPGWNKMDDVNSTYSGSGTLSYTITGGPARHQKVSPKTWRISAFADARMTPSAIWFLLLMQLPLNKAQFWARYDFYSPWFLQKYFVVFSVVVLDFLHNFWTSTIFFKDVHFVQVILVR